MRSRLVIQVAGKTDYAVGKLPHELLIRLAPAGQAPDLAAPVLVRLERRGERAAPGRRARAPPPAAVAPPTAAHGRRRLRRQHRRRRRDRGGGGGAAQMAALHPPAPSGRADAAPRAQPRTRGSGASAVVVIDPGHGGYDSGTEAGAPLLEKDLALQIALRLQGELERRGVRRDTHSHG